MPANLENSAVSSGHRTGRGQCSFQSQRKAMPKNAQTTTQTIYKPTVNKIHGPGTEAATSLISGTE